jgi:hypothetical protein
MGVCLWDLSLGQHTGDGKLGETFLGRTWMFFSGGGGGFGGEGKRNSRARLPRRFRRTTRVPNIPVYVMYYIFHSGGFRCSMSSGIAKGSSIRLPWADTCAVRLRQPVDLVHALKTVKGLFLLVLPRTPRSSGYDVYSHTFHLVMCYMSITCILIATIYLQKWYSFPQIIVEIADYYTVSHTRVFFLGEKKSQVHISVRECA